MPSWRRRISQARTGGGISSCAVALLAQAAPSRQGGSWATGCSASTFHQWVLSTGFFLGLRPRRCPRQTSVVEACVPRWLRPNLERLQRELGAAFRLR